MDMSKFSLILIFCCLNWLLAPYAVAADKSSCRLISRSDAIQQATSRSGGKVVSVKLNRNGRKSVYRIRVLVGDKRVRNLSIKACR